jgi:hypothetical protein
MIDNPGTMTDVDRDVDSPDGREDIDMVAM